MVRQAHHERRPEDFEKALAKPPLPLWERAGVRGILPSSGPSSPENEPGQYPMIIGVLALIVPYWNLVGQPLTQ